MEVTAFLLVRVTRVRALARIIVFGGLDLVTRQSCSN